MAPPLLRAGWVGLDRVSIIICDVTDIVGSCLHQLNKAFLQTSVILRLTHRFESPAFRSEALQLSNYDTSDICCIDSNDLEID